MSEAHSASAIGRHIQCHGSADLTSAIPGWVPPVEDPTVNNAANRGTIMHELFANIAHLKQKDMTMFLRALEYVTELRATRRFKVLVEHSITAEWLKSQPRTTADLVLYLSDELHIIDYKTGMIPVSVVNNEQMMFYAASYGFLAPKAKHVTLHIVQPWANNIEAWTVSSKDIAQFMHLARQTEKAIDAGSLQLMPGDHCTFCPANPHSRGAKGRPFCPAMMQLLYPAPLEEDEILALEIEGGE